MSVSNQRVVSGIRATGQLHLGHYHGVLANWVKLQHEYECFFFVADWHALTTHYEDPRVIQDSVLEVMIDYLAAGLDPDIAKLFIQSHVPEHAELQLLLSMITPLAWLERIPTYKDQQEKLKQLDLSTYGFLGYPLLQAADVLIYKAGYVPVGEDQVAHVEFCRDVARKFNFIYGREPDFEERALQAVKKMGKKQGKLYLQLHKAFQEQGDDEALAKAQALLTTQNNLSYSDRDRLMGYLEGGGKIILAEPQSLLTETSKLTGLDGQKMSKSYNNVINLRDTEEQVDSKIKQMQTDPARVRRSDPGEPEKCPVYSIHKVYSDVEKKSWVEEGCRSAGIGCIDCKKCLSDGVNAFHRPMREKIAMYEEDRSLVLNVVNEGAEAAREVAQETMREVKEVMDLNYGERL
jgi:tryptophanyl-tRNA synthetase